MHAQLVQQFDGLKAQQAGVHQLIALLKINRLTTSLRVVSMRERLISCLTDEVQRVEIGSPVCTVAQVAFSAPSCEGISWQQSTLEHEPHPGCVLSAAGACTRAIRLPVEGW